MLLSATGALNKWKMPDIPGLDSFKGPVMHSATWDPNFDVTGKRIALIGGGASGIQILPQIAPKAKYVDHYMKGKTWIPPFGIGALGVLNRSGDRKYRPIVTMSWNLRRGSCHTARRTGCMERSRQLSKLSEGD